MRGKAGRRRRRYRGALDCLRPDIIGPSVLEDARGIAALVGSEEMGGEDVLPAFAFGSLKRLVVGSQHVFHDHAS
jgi:hypothetical protein